MATSRRMVCVDDFERYARESLSQNAFDYYRSGACEEITQRDNIEAFKRYKILPRVMRDVSTRDMHTTILGHRVAVPIGIAPTAMQKMAHLDGEVGMAKAAASMDTVFTLSTYATTSMEEVSEKVPGSLKFFQLYIPQERDRLITKDLVGRSEEAGFNALVLTVDSPMLGIRYSNLRNHFMLPPQFSVANLEKTFSNKDIVPDQNADDLRDNRNFRQDASLTWADVKWLTSYSRLPVVIKGILTPEDAILAVDHGAAAVWISNHGGRQLDTVPATLDVLPSIVSAVAGRCEVYLDGGVRRGTDVLKALALGAKAVFIGTPAIYGLAYDGENGTRQVLEILRDEFSSAMALSGCANVADITSDLVIHESRLNAKL